MPKPSSINGRHILLCRKLREARVALGISQATVSTRMGIMRPNLSRLEKGRHCPSISSLLDYCDAIGVRLSDIIREIESNPLEESQPQL